MKKINSYRVLSVLGATVVAVSLFTLLVGTSLAQSSGGTSFGKSVLHGESSALPTTLQFGPDGRLYVGQQNGLIKAYTVQRDGANDYKVTASESIDLVKKIPNHNDDGTLNTTETNRQVTGIVVAGTASNPIIYAASSDPRIGAGSDGTGDVNLDTNSGIVSRLSKSGSSWNKVDLVRGLPRSEENHAPNGMQLSSDGKKLYLAMGGNANKGAPSSNFALLPEYALSAAILEIDLEAIGSTTLDLQTLDDEDRSGTSDANDPFGGNDGKNQAKPDSKVKVYAPGFRNPYDLVITEGGKMYTIDNGANAGWGDVPVGEGPGGNCTNDPNEPGTTDQDSLHLVSGAGYYGGHPNPTRGNTDNTFNASNPQSPVATENPVECDFRANGTEKGSLTTFPASTNGIAEYTATDFGGAMKGNLLAAAYNENKLYRLIPNASGTAVTKEALASTIGSKPLDVTTQGDSGAFPGTIWVADIVGQASGTPTGDIVVFEPEETTTCTGAPDPALDEDKDGFDNKDEIDNGTNPCSSADTPSDHDGDKESDLNDPDDDNDSLPDTSDPFAVDKDNGKTTTLPVSYTWDNDGSSQGGLLNLGFTGLMTNKSADYKSLFDENNMTTGGAAGAVTVDKVSAGDAWKSSDTQQYGFQFGVNATPTTGKFTAHTRILAPFAGLTPENSQAMGLFIGNGDQDNYVKLVINANDGAGGLQFVKEINETIGPNRQVLEPLPGPDAVDLFLTVDTVANTVQPSYVVTTNGDAGQLKNVGSATAIPAGWVSGTTGLAVGIISTSTGPGPEFPATWDLIEVSPGNPSTSACTIMGTAGDDTLNGTSGNDVICGLGGNDTINGAGGNDTIKGGEGNDTIKGGTGMDTVSYSDSKAPVTANLSSATATGEGSDTLTSVENIIGSPHDDTLTGTSGVNVMKGLTGADTMTAGGGDDTLDSKDGVSGNDTLAGGTGTDTCITDATEKSIKSCP
jgi:Ca2+-binding RTX toxin-like protein